MQMTKCLDMKACQCIKGQTNQGFNKEQMNTTGQPVNNRADLEMVLK